MNCCDDTTWLEARLAATEALIIATESAVALVSSGAQSYSLDSGQTRQQVTRSTLMDLRLSLRELDDRREKIRNDLGLCNPGGRQVRVIPGF